jgi:hypothetical protein
MEENKFNKEETIKKWEKSGLLEGLIPMDENSQTPYILAPDTKQVVKEKQSMYWIVKIENKPNQRIMVKFDPMKELLYFIGQYKIRVLWIDFSQEEYSMNITLEVIQDLLFNVYEKMNERLKVHEDLNKSFNAIKEIEINEE